MSGITIPVQTDKPKLAVYKFSSCDGCQLTLLNLEDHILDIAGAVEISFFLEARRRVLPPPYDIGLIEGSISTPEEEQRVHQVRRDCKYLIAIGACATSGGIQSLRNWANVKEYAGLVYPSPEYLKTLETSTPVAAHVFVDFELRGCPISGDQLLEVISALLAGRKPNIPSYSVCMECKRKGLPCVLVSKGEPCLGPITQAGCDALCPGCSRACYGCFGPMDQPNIQALGGKLTGELKQSNRDMKRMLRTFNGYLEPFKQASDYYERLEKE